YWLLREKVKSLAGSVVLAGGDAASHARSESALREILSDDWEILTSESISECSLWNRDIAHARSDVIDFLLASMLQTAAQFRDLAPRACVGAVAPACDGDLIAAGDIAGMMMPRLDALLVGPLPEHVSNTRVALEEYAMLLDSKLPPAWRVEADLV